MNMTARIALAAAALALGACQTTHDAAGADICRVPIADRSGTIKASDGPWSVASMARIDDAISSYVANDPKRYAGWSRPALPPQGL